MVHKLLEAGADAKLLDHRGCTALQCAAEGGHAEIFERLLEAGCSALCADDAGVTVLHSAAQGSSLELVEECLDLGADPLATTQLGRSVLHFAAFGGSLAGPVSDASVSALLLLMSPKGAANCHVNAWTRCQRPGHCVAGAHCCTLPLLESCAWTWRQKRSPEHSVMLCHSWSLLDLKCA